MAESTSIQNCSSEELFIRCEEESRRYRDITPVAGYCMEAFRRAVVEGDETCWLRLRDVYRNQILAWCRSANGPPIPADDLVAFVWEKFWQNYKPAKWAQASSLAQVLSYLKLCAISAVFDARREHATLTSLDNPIKSADGSVITLGALIADQAPDPERVAAEKLDRERLLRVVNGELKDRKERLVITGKFELGLTSREIYAAHPDAFVDVTDVYRVTRNVLERLGRRLQAWNGKI